jgi:hypothetical protein
MNDLCDLLVADGSRSAATGPHRAEAVDTLSGEAFAPRDDRHAGDAQLSGNRVVRAAVGGTQDDARAGAHCLRRAPRS